MKQMKIGLATYTYHRYLGDPYIEVQSDPGVRWTMTDVVRKARELGLEGVLLETCVMPSLDRTFLRQLASEVRGLGLECTVSWGSPNGLNTGRSPEAVADLLAHLEVMDLLGARVLRIVGGSKRTAHEPHGPALERLANVIGEQCVRPAEKAGVVLAFENHWDYTSREVLSLLDKVRSPWLMVCYDCGNALRVGEDPVEAARLLAPYTVCTNLKDIGHPITEATDWRAEFPCVPFGRGRIDMAGVCRALYDADSPSIYAIEMDRPREDYLDEDAYVLECVRYLLNLRDSWTATSVPQCSA